MRERENRGKSKELKTKRERKKNSWDGETDRDTCVPKDSEDLAGSFLAGTTGLQTLLGVLWLDERRPSQPRDRRRKAGDAWTPCKRDAVKFNLNPLSFLCFFLSSSLFQSHYLKGHREHYGQRQIAQIVCSSVLFLLSFVLFHVFRKTAAMFLVVGRFGTFAVEHGSLTTGPALHVNTEAR